MATFRPIRISYWQDKFILSLTPEQKYFYLYLMTNSKTKQCGIYELPKNIISFETGYNLDTINKLITHFINQGKILYDNITEEVYIKNWVKFNQIDNKNIYTCVSSELAEIKSKIFLKEFSKAIEYMNTNQEYTDKIKETCKGLTRGYPNPIKKETETETELKAEFENFWDTYNKKIGNKESIYKLYRKLKEEDRKEIIETLPAYILSTPDKKFRKNPQTYLKQKGWLDEIITSNRITKEKFDLEPLKY